MNSNNDYNESYSSLDQLFSGSELKILNQIGKTSNFTLEPDKEAKENDVGFSTNMATRVIYYNPHTINSLSSFRKFAIFGHELGHHFKEIVEFQDECEKLIPLCIEEYLDNFLGNQRATELMYSIINVIADVALESCIPKYGEIATSKLLQNAFIQNRGILFIESIKDNDTVKLLESFDDSNRKIFPWEKLGLGKGLLFNEYLSIYLIAPFFGLPEKELLRKEIQDKFETISEVIEVLKDPLNDAQTKAKYLIYVTKDVSELLEKDREKIEEKDSQQSKYKQTSIEELNEIIDNILSEIAKITGEIPKKDKENKGNNAVNNQDKTDEKPSKGNLSEVISESNKMLNKAVDFVDELNQEKAVLLGVKYETYIKFLQISSEYNTEIKSLKDTLLKYVLQDYRNITQRNKRGGFMPTPGKEAETYIRTLSGERNPNTDLKRNKVIFPKRLQLYFLIDTSGSMYRDLDGTLGYYTIFSKAVLEIQEELLKNKAKYNLPRGVLSPIQIEVVGFENFPKLVLDINEKITLKKLAQGFEYISDSTEIGGGTNDLKALKFEYSRMKLQDENVIKIMSMITDGGGYGDSIEPILNQIEDDKSIYFLVNGIGDQAMLVKECYQKKFKPSSSYHVYAEESKNAKEAAIKTTGFLKQVIKNKFKKKPV